MRQPLLRRRLATPLGRIELVASNAGVHAVHLQPGDAPLARMRSTTTAHRSAVAHLDRAQAYIEAVLLGHRPPALPNLVLEGLTAFTRELLMVTSGIPRGTVLTYRQVAELMGRPRAMRAVGQALGRNPLPLLIPCHRVIAADGIGGFSPSVELKRQLLLQEGHQRFAAQ